MSHPNVIKMEQSCSSGFRLVSFATQAILNISLIFVSLHNETHRKIRYLSEQLKKIKFLTRLVIYCIIDKEISLN